MAPAGIVNLPYLILESSDWINSIVFVAIGDTVN